MNTGERLTSLSGLSPRSAFDHSMAIVTGGVNKTVFASQMTVCLEEPNSIVIQRPAYQAKTDGMAVSTRQNPPYQNKKRIDVCLNANRTDVVVPEESIYVITRNETLTATTRLDKTFSTKTR